jgi:hypothetical protein
MESKMRQFEINDLLKALAGDPDAQLRVKGGKMYFCSIMNSAVMRCF